jgi:KaiC/GvpD/RAD55 family RecA-like ATPase
VLKSLSATLLIILALAISSSTQSVNSAGSAPQNTRLFYLSSQSMSLTPTSTPSNLTFRRGPVSFNYGLLSGPLTVSGTITFSLWINWMGNITASPPSVIGTFDYKFPGGGSNWNNASSTAPTVIPPGLHNVNATYTVGAGIPLTIGTQIAVGLNITSIPKKANITMVYGPLVSPGQIPSHVGLVLSGYANMPQVNPVLVLDHQQIQTSTFDLSPGPGNNIVLIEASAFSAFGLNDMSLNLTILDPNSLHVAKATNISMTPNPFPTSSQLYQFFATWLYPSNATQGTYQVRIDIIDSQNNIAYTLPTPGSFALVPRGYIPFPYNLIPYLIVGGASASGGVAGAVAYRRRRGRSYLVPFDYFNTLTGGELSGGTIVTVEGNTGSGKTLLLEQLMSEDLRKGRPCVFVSTGEFPDNVRANMKTMGVDVAGYEQKGLLTFVDGYSAEAGQDSKEKVSIPSLGDLTTLGIKLTSALPSPSFRGGSLYFDSLTPLASRARSESIVSFVQSLGAKVKGLGGKAFFAVGLGIDTTVRRQLEDTTDCIVQMEAFEESGSRRRRLRIAKFRGRKHQDSWALFTIEEGKGIIFYSKKPRQ